MRAFLALVAIAVAISTVSAQTATGPNFYITGAEGQANYNFLIAGATVPDPTLELTVENTYKIFLNATMNSHPFGFSSNNTDPITLLNTTKLTEFGVSVASTCTVTNGGYTTADPTNPCFFTITPPAQAEGLSFYYRCNFHSAMIGTLHANAATTTAPTTATPTTPGTPTTTVAPTIKPGSSTGGNGAAALVPGAAIIIAVINALFA